MKFRILTTVSAIAMMAAVAMPAHAMSENDDYRARTYSQSHRENMDRIQNMKMMDERQAGEISERTMIERPLEQDTSYRMRERASAAPFLTESIQVSQNNTARGMIGKKTYTPDGEVVASVEDIIIDRNGNAEKVVLRDSGFLGMGGSLVSMDYDRLVRPERQGDVLQSVDRGAMNQARRFSYAASPGSRDAMPVDGLSVAQILDGDLLDANNRRVARVDNLTFRDGNVDYLIVSYNDVFGMGGETAAIRYSDLQPVRTGSGSVDFRLSGNQSQDFQDYRNMTQRRTRY